jgi:spermidine/putrescine-binding protein
MDTKEQAAKSIKYLERELRHGRLSRREFLTRSSGLLLWATLAAGGSIVTGCGAQPTSEPTQAADPSPTTPSGEVVWVAEETVSREDHFAAFPDSVDITRVLLTDTPAMIQKLRTGTQRADVVEANYSFMYHLREYDLIQSIDEGRLSNWDNVLPVFQKFEDLRSDSGELQMIPNFWGTDAITYNADEVSEEDASSYEVLFSEEYADRIAIRNDAQETLAWVGIVLGHDDIWNQTQDELQESIDFLKEHKSKFRLLWTTLADLEAAFVNGEVVVAQCWFPMVKMAQDGGINAKWSHPKEGAITWLEGQTISKDAEELGLAHLLLDYLLSDDWAQSFYEETGYRVATDWQLRNLSDEKIEELSLDNAGELLESGYLWGTTLNMENYQEAWTEFLSA